MSLSQSLFDGFHWLYPHKDIICPHMFNQNRYCRKTTQAFPQRKSSLCMYSLQKPLFKRYTNPKCPICLRPCLPVLITSYFRCNLSKKMKTELGVTKHPHFSQHEDHRFCRVCINKQSKCPICKNFLDDVV